MSYIRVVRFTDVAPEKIEEIRARIEESGGPPEGVVSTGIKFCVDEEQGTAVVLQFFDSEENMTKSAEVLNAMDSNMTPGTRASVDTCEVKVEADA